MGALARYTFLAYCVLRSVAMFKTPTLVYGMFPAIDFTAKASEDANAVALASARALADLILACGMLTFGGLTGRCASLLVIFPMFYVNHVVDGLAHPPIVPVVATNVVVLLANIYEAGCGGKLGKYSYAIMQGGFGLLFLTEAPDLVQDPFTFAKEGTAALMVGQKLGFAIGFVLCAHAVMTLVKPPMGCVAAMAIIFLGMAKMAYVDSIPVPRPSVIAATICMALCLIDALFLSGGAEKPKKK